MTNLGRSAVFCFKYWEQMRPFVMDEEGKDVLLEREEIRQNEKMIRRVAERARQQVVEFLNACASESEKHFKQWFDAEIITRISTTQEEWYVSLIVWPRGRPKPSSVRWTTGICLDFLDRRDPFLIPYFWVGERESAAKLDRILGERVKDVPEGFHWNDWSKMIVTPEIPIPARECNDFEIAMEPLIEKVIVAFSTITKEDIDLMKKI